MLNYRIAPVGAVYGGMPDKSRDHRTVVQRVRNQQTAHELLDRIQANTAEGRGMVYVSSPDNGTIRLSYERRGAIARFRQGPLAGLVSLLSGE
jgi:hypothetical protein